MDDTTAAAAAVADRSRCKPRSAWLAARNNSATSERYRDLQDIHCSKWSQPRKKHCPIPPSAFFRVCKITITGAAASREVIFSHREIPHPPRQRQHHHVPFVCVLRLACCCCGAHQCHRVSALTKGEGGGGGTARSLGVVPFSRSHAMPPRGELKGRCPREGARQQTGCHSWQYRRRIPLHTARGGGAFDAGCLLFFTRLPRCPTLRRPPVNPSRSSRKRELRRR